MRTTRLRVRLREVTPAVVRVIDVPAAITLPELHDVLQVAVGWTDSHLHQFVVGPRRYGVPDDDGDPDEHDESTVRLRELPARFRYLYDFGDGWEHDIDVLGPGADQPGCRYGEGPCPPEDVGGPFGYAELLAVLADPSHDEHDAMREWAGELVGFDPAAADLLVKQTVGLVPASVRLVLDVIGDGVTLTPGGRLPRALVRQVQQQRPGWHGLGRPATLEDDLPPLAAVHDLLRQVGLLRLARGVLRPTKAAGDDLELVRRLRSWFPPGEFTTILAGDTVAMLAVIGSQRLDDLAAQVYRLVDPRWARDGQPLTERDVLLSMVGLSSVLEGLDQVEIHDWTSWSAGPAARSLLPRATALAQIWTTGRHKIRN